MCFFSYCIPIIKRSVKTCNEIPKNPLYYFRPYFLHSKQKCQLKVSHFNLAFLSFIYLFSQIFLIFYFLYLTQLYEYFKLKSFNSSISFLLSSLLASGMKISMVSLAFSCFLFSSIKSMVRIL